jgi:hypothetical protein
VSQQSCHGDTASLHGARGSARAARRFAHAEQPLRLLLRHREQVLSTSWQRTRLAYYVQQRLQAGAGVAAQLVIQIPVFREGRLQPGELPDDVLGSGRPVVAELSS